MVVVLAPYFAPFSFFQKGNYNEAYMLNWESNVFPGKLGRTCDRPCEPECRRNRTHEKAVAICRLKRVTYDYKDDIAILTLERSFNFKTSTKKGFHTLKPGILGDFFPKGKVYFHYMSRLVCRIG